LKIWLSLLKEGLPLGVEYGSNQTTQSDAALDELAERDINNTINIGGIIIKKKDLFPFVRTSDPVPKELNLITFDTINHKYSINKVAMYSDFSRLYNYRNYIVTWCYGTGGQVALCLINKTNYAVTIKNLGSLSAFMSYTIIIDDNLYTLVLKYSGTIPDRLIWVKINLRSMSITELNRHDSYLCGTSVVYPK